MALKLICDDRLVVSNGNGRVEAKTMSRSLRMLPTFGVPNDIPNVRIHCQTTWTKERHFGLNKIGHVKPALVVEFDHRIPTHFGCFLVPPRVMRARSHKDSFRFGVS